MSYMHYMADSVNLIAQGKYYTERWGVRSAEHEIRDPLDVVDSLSRKYGIEVTG